MKRVAWLLILVFLLCFLTGCRPMLDTKASIQYVQDHQDLLLSCAHELEAMVEGLSGKADDHMMYYYISPQDGASMNLCDDADRTVLSFESELCKEVLADGTILIIKIWASPNEFSLTFNFEGRGNYHYAVYAPSDEAQDIRFYDPCMTYSEKEGGYYGEESNGNNTFFYCHIAEQLYYCEAHF